MPLYAIENKKPTLIGEGHFIAPSADIIGDVVLHSQSSVWFNTVIRGENDRIEIGEGSNIQDGSVLHVDPGFPLTIGKQVTIGHKVMLHGCTVGDGSLVGINAVVLNGANIGKGCLIGANSLVTEGMQIPDGALVLGSPAKVKKILSAEQQQQLLKNSESYINNSARFNQSLLKLSADGC
jgi:carbonic anhydrase/acetyltransferase-like protein (isoleucine patch superfamily)